MKLFLPNYQSISYVNSFIDNRLIPFYNNTPSLVREFGQTFVN